MISTFLGCRLAATAREVTTGEWGLTAGKKEGYNRGSCGRGWLDDLQRREGEDATQATVKTTSGGACHHALGAGDSCSLGKEVLYPPKRRRFDAEKKN